jgi:hypothetical protein
MSLIDGGPGITIPGIVSNLPLDTSHTESVTYWAPGPGGQHPEAELILGETLAHGVIRLDSADPRYYDALSKYAAECAAFLREGTALAGAA